MTRLLLALPLLLLPFAAQAACSGHSSDQQAMSCAPGTTWDRDRAACVPVTG